MNTTSPLQPSPSLLCKLGSIVVHADEMMSAGGHAFDKVALQQLIKDADVADWIRQMNAMAMVPRKRKEPTPTGERSGEGDKGE